MFALCCGLLRWLLSVVCRSLFVAWRLLSDDCRLVVDGCCVLVVV